jgi:hypothetical protein
VARRVVANSTLFGWCIVYPLPDLLSPTSRTHYA